MYMPVYFHYYVTYITTVNLRPLISAYFEYPGKITLFLYFTF